MKLEFFQRKFWTASRQVSYGRHGSLGGAAMIQVLTRGSPEPHVARFPMNVCKMNHQLLRLLFISLWSKGCLHVRRPVLGSRDLAPIDSYDSESRRVTFQRIHVFFYYRGLWWIVSDSLLILSHLAVYLCTPYCTLEGLRIAGFGKAPIYPLGSEGFSVLENLGVFSPGPVF